MLFHLYFFPIFPKTINGAGRSPPNFFSQSFFAIKWKTERVLKLFLAKNAKKFTWLRERNSLHNELGSLELRNFQMHKKYYLLSNPWKTFGWSSVNSNTIYSLTYASKSRGKWVKKVCLNCAILKQKNQISLGLYLGGASFLITCVMHCRSGYYKIFWFPQLSLQCKLPTLKSFWSWRFER